MESKTNDLHTVTEYFQMTGDSMDDGGNVGFINGDILCCNKVDIQSIEVDECYVLVTHGKINVLKVILFDGERIVATKLNPHYPEQEFAKDEVQDLYLVKSYQRKIADDIEL